MKHTPEHITALRPDEIIIVGTNTAGRHGAGAAKQAHDDFGLEDGVGEGLSGKTYAFPTLDENLNKRGHKDLMKSVRKLFAVASANPGKTFLLTKVGCGIAGYQEGYMRMLFRVAPDNIIKPANW
jgi:hypothetical protein